MMNASLQIGIISKSSQNSAPWILPRDITYPVISLTTSNRRKQTTLQRGKVKYELGVASSDMRTASSVYELQVYIYEIRVSIHKL